MAILNGPATIVSSRSKTASSNNPGRRLTLCSYVHFTVYEFQVMPPIYGLKFISYELFISNFKSSNFVAILRIFC